MTLLTLCPSRGRPDNAIEAYASFVKMKAEDSHMIFVVDADDPTVGQYTDNVPTDVIEPSGRRGMTGPLNEAAARYWDSYEVIGFIGDDHRFRTPYWDRIMGDYLVGHGGGFAYANDLNWKDGEIPTSIFGSSSIWKALGWVALPEADHLYLDNTWRVLGDGADCLFYFPLVIIEHVHPAYGKAEWDDGYKLVNSATMYNHDREAFESWLTTRAPEDIERVRQSRPG